MKFEWEGLYQFDLNSCSIVSCKSIVDKHGISLSESMVFIPDHNHEWKIDK